ncbi:hypothetical protein [Streptomyces sp. B1I3]|uniref:hypothetical protein n=1 Tax=Streptomyces sp. B1I3 TaxID=3042264 RepID=UPI00277F2315|nr:hypothetical protein [Streptomyces sp. B1I3]MDQ0791798.1 ATPase subunit of ABC transporter with duplicated ATPase domains [Streptomyces sp. B1I3]
MVTDFPSTPKHSVLQQFARARFVRPTARLSAGQLQRLALARLVSRPVDVLLRDERTNHFSPSPTEDPEATSAGFAGALALAGLDRLLGRLEGNSPDPARPAPPQPDTEVTGPAL